MASSFNGQSYENPSIAPATYPNLQRTVGNRALQTIRDNGSRLNGAQVKSLKGFVQRMPTGDGVQSAVSRAQPLAEVFFQTTNGTPLIQRNGDNNGTGSGGTQPRRTPGRLNVVWPPPSQTQDPQTQPQTPQVSVATPEIAQVVNQVVGEPVAQVTTTAPPPQNTPPPPTEAEQIAAIKARILTNYGIDVNSRKGVKATNKDYFGDETVNPKNLKARKWKLWELEALEDVLKQYAPILGANRATSTLSGKTQKVKSFSRVSKGLDVVGGTVKKDPDTLGETFTGSKNISLYDSAKTDDDAFPGDIPKTLRVTIAHELSHGLTEKTYLNTFVSRFGDYWRDEDTRVQGTSKVAAPGVEAPISSYGATNAAEDLAESSGYFFVDKDTLKNGHLPTNPGKVKGEPGNPAPKRVAFMERIVAEWTSQPVKDFGKAADAFLDAAKSLTAITTQVQAKYNAAKAKFDPLPSEDRRKILPLKREIDARVSKLGGTAT